VLVLYGAWGLWRPRLPQLSAHARVAGAVAGALTGAVTAATAVFVVPLVPYLQALRLEKETMVQALGLSFTLATLALALRLQLGGHGPALFGALTLPALLAAFAGLALGTAVRRRIGAAAFQRALFGVLIGLGCVDLLRG
jgi:uncharacterized membrane protein YfcA